VSKLAAKDVLRTLFSIVGTVLCFEHYPKYGPGIIGLIIL